MTDYRQFIENTTKILGHDSDFFEKMRKKTIRRPDLKIEARVIHHWEKQNLLLVSKPESAHYLFSLTESFWIKIIQRLREYNISLEQIRSLKEIMTEPAPMDVPIDELVRVIQQIDSNLSAQEVKEILLSGDLKKFMDGLTVTVIEVLLITLIGERPSLRCLLNHKGEVYFTSDNTNLELDQRFQTFLSGSYLSVSLNEIIQEIVRDIEVKLPSSEPIILSIEEKEVLRQIREGEAKSIQINFNDKTKDIETIKVTKKMELSTANRIADIILRNGYQHITITTQNGQIAYCENTIKLKNHDIEKNRINSK